MQSIAQQLRPARIEALGAPFVVSTPTSALPLPQLLDCSIAAADASGVFPAWLESEAALALLSGDESTLGHAPLSSVYSGHQFGVWAGQLGDGRAHLLGETPAGWEVQIKGAGRTPFSRMGDGRAVLRSSVREYLASEAMAALAVPTTRALSLIGSSLPVFREERETAAIVARTAPSFLRFGHFEHFFSLRDFAALRTLADFAIDQYFPDIRSGNDAGPLAYATLLRTVARRSAELVVQWQALGFCHGVLNTDNMSLLGLTLDYGPFQFIDGFAPAHICNHSDTQGRYALNQQPAVVQWNLTRLAQALLPLIDDSQAAIAALNAGFSQPFPALWQTAMGCKLGLSVQVGHESEDLTLVQDLLQLLAAEATDFTIFWHRLTQFVADSQAAPLNDLFLDRAALSAWLQRYEARLTLEDPVKALARMRAANPQIVLRNHLAQTAIEQAARGDLEELRALRLALQHPYAVNTVVQDEARLARYLGFSPDWASTLEVSCSS